MSRVNIGEKNKKRFFKHFSPAFWHFCQPLLAPELLKLAVYFVFNELALKS